MAGSPYPIVVSGAVSTNYSFVYNNGKLIINQVPLTITADNKTMQQGNGAPTLTATYTGLVNGDSPASLPTPPTLATTANAASLPGQYPITVSGAVDTDYTIRFVAGTMTVSASQNVAIVSPDPQLPGKTVLSVFGTSSNDDLKVLWVNSSGDVRVTNHGKPLGTFRPTGRIIVYGLAGNDTITVDSKIKLPDLLYGGDGNDNLFAGGGWSLLEGGAGSDDLIGGTGRAILVGGIGRDTLIGGTDNNVLIGGTTAYDNNDQALMALLTTWANPAATFGSRVSQITGAGAYSLNKNTVIDDQQANTLTGGKLADLFFKGASDKLRGQNSSDVIISLL